MSRCCLVPVALGLVVSAAQAGILTVDDDGPADFSVLQEAVDAASPGDVILVQRGNYAGFVLDGKPLAILAAEPGAANQPWLHEGAVVQNLPGGQTVLVAGLRIDGSDSPEPPPPEADALLVESCEGAVRVQGALLVGFESSDDGTPVHAGLRVHASHDVVLRDCSLVGAEAGIVNDVMGGNGLQVDEATVTAWFCDIRGGKGSGWFEFWITSGIGGYGTHVADGSLAVLESCAVVGGAGGDSSIMWQYGGVGLHVDATATAWLRATSPVGGAGGLYFWGFGGGPGPDGAPSEILGTQLLLPGTPVPLTTSLLLAAPGDSVTLSCEGSGLLFVGLQGLTVPLPGWLGPLHVFGDLAFPVGFLVPLTVPALPAGFPDALVVHLQAALATHEVSSPALLVLAADPP